jgi:pSer/pThr/pTyr-binding forkhead associated (FHA) protein
MPVMPLTLHPSPTEARGAGATDAAAETQRLDALPRMTYRARLRTISETRPAPGRYLVVEDGDEHRLLRLTPGATHIGRAWGADLRLDDKAVSRRHAIVYVTAESVRILDDRSANGTRVNGLCASGAELDDGDVILVGQVVLTYREFG